MPMPSVRVGTPSVRPPIVMTSEVVSPASIASGEPQVGTLPSTGRYVGRRHRGIEHVTDTTPDHEPEAPEDTRSAFVPPKAAITGGFSKNADLISYIVAGLLIGLFLDWVFGTTPVMIIIWTLLGVAVGYWRLWQSSAELEEQAKERSHGA